MSFTSQDLDLPPGARVVVAMSGGVDSSVTAAVMAEAGYEVVGITLQLYDHGVAVGKKGACCAGQDIYDAKRVAEQIGIPHYVLDYERRFKEAVMADFAESYAAGETPIPCVRCNQRVKFRDLLATARDLGAVALATGHYVRREPGPRLLKAVEEGRDQSYFLFATTRDELDFLRFPLGGLAKDETRRLAERFNLPVAQKPDSQDICFVPTGKYAQVVERLKPGAAEEGEIVDLSGRVLGRHAGIIHFTVGQRRGLGVAGGEPLYVVKLDAQQRRVVVGPQAALATAELTLREVNWLADRADDMAVSVKVRSAQPPVSARLWLEGVGGRLIFDRPELGVAPGQAAVCYDGDRVLGGGWIAKTQSAYLAEGRVA